jgi:outer membrane protein assembly factor BamB
MSSDSLRWQAVGRRKTSVARVYLTPGTGKWDVNGRTLGDYFPRPSLVQHIQQSFTATDQRTGETLWSTPLLGPHAQRAAAGEQAYGGGCQGDAERGTPSTVAVCVVTDGFSVYGSDGTNEESVPATTTRVMVLDVQDGHVTAEWPAQGMVRLAVLDGLVVVGTGEPGAGRVVVGHDLRSGEERWRYEEPPGDDPQQYWGVLAAGGLVGLYDEDTLTLLSPTGTVLRDALPVDSGYGGGFSTDPVTGLISLVTYADDGTELTTLLAPDADPAADVVLDGTLLNVAVDDRSLPELVLTYQSRTFGWDRTTGEALWEAEVQPNYGVLVIRGRVYLTTSTEVVALDGRTGEVVWRTPLPELGEGSLATDGRDLLLLSPKLGPGDDTGGVTFFDLGSGDVIRSLPYPEGVSDIQEMSGVLAAWSDGTEQVMIVR